MDSLAPAATGLMTPPGRMGTALAGRCVVLFLPAALLAVGAAADPGPNPTLNWLGTGLVAVLALALLPQPRLTQLSTGLAVITEYILAQVWLWYTGDFNRDRWFPHLSLGVLLIVPLLLFAGVSLERSGRRPCGGPGCASADCSAAKNGQPT